MRTPVALIIFRRPDLTERVFAEIAKAKPPQLFVIADGPRPSQPGEAEECAAARKIVERVDWKCELLKNYSDINLGCGRRPATGISWVFEQVEEAIILEDDCVPHPTFFRFCEELLEKYRYDERVMHISGNNFQFGKKWSSHSYYFSHWNHSWGWAAWRRAWQHFDIGLKLWPVLRDKAWLADILQDSTVAAFYRSRFELAYAAEGNIDFWDYQWTFACWAHNGLSILPNSNLVSNIGFGPAATHTMSPSDIGAAIPAPEMNFPLHHPPYLLPDGDADQYFTQKIFVPWLPKKPRFYDKLRQACAGAIPRTIRNANFLLRPTTKV